MRLRCHGQRKERKQTRRPLVAEIFAKSVTALLPSSCTLLDRPTVVHLNTKQGKCLCLRNQFVSHMRCLQGIPTAAKYDLAKLLAASADAA